MISVITATFNHARFLPGAVASLRAQTCRDWEHIVIDDGSTDETPEVVAGLRPEPGDPDAERWRAFRIGHQGLDAARNFGLAIARGDLVTFLDSDDEYLPDHLALMQETLRGRDFALGRYLLVNCSPDPVPLVADFYHPGQAIEAEQVESGSGLLFGKRMVFLQVGGFRRTRLSDTDLFVRMKAAGYSWSRAPRPTYRWFFGRVPGNMSALELALERAQVEQTP
ncbi:MAG: glycosyltransferase family A protein [Holophaga sp.]|jgi:glycosyltransferase involved in cell wall biosynthesis